MEPIISIRHLNHYYGANALKKQVLFDINLDIVPGEIVIMTGPSGSGKTTLLTLLGGLRSVQSGSLHCLGRELAGASESNLVSVRRHIGYIFQAHNLLPFMTARQNVGMSLEMHQGINRRLSQLQASEMLAQVGLGERINYYPGKLSGGQKQRVAIARALVSQPRLVLADEPTASLDKKTGRDVVDLMHRLVKQQGCTILLVTHDNRILDIADRIIHMEDGKLISLTAQAASAPIPSININPSLFPPSDPGELIPSTSVKSGLHQRSSDSEPVDTVTNASPNNNGHTTVEVVSNPPIETAQPTYIQPKPSLQPLSPLNSGLVTSQTAYSPQDLIAAGFSRQTITDTNFLRSAPPAIAPESKIYRVVCIDTDTQFINSVEQLLGKKYFQTIAVADPVKALVMVLEHKPDLILMEVKITNFNGYRLCKLIRQNPLLKRTPIIITTKQRGNVIGRLRATISGASGYLVKPLSQVDLITNIFPHVC